MPAILLNTSEVHIPEKHSLVVTVIDPERETALHAWNSWRIGTDLDHISNIELSVIPMVYQRWKTDTGFSFDERLAGIARKSFYQNTLYSQATETITSQLADQRIPYRLIRDSLICLTLSQSTSLSRATQSIDLWIDDHIDETVRIVTSLGWKYDRHFRFRVTLVNDHGLRLNVYHKASRHWTNDKHERFFAGLNEAGSRTVNCIIDLLVSKYPNGQAADLQSIIDLQLLLQQLSENEAQDLIQYSQYYLLSCRLNKGLQMLTHQYGLKTRLNSFMTIDSDSADPLTVLETLFQKWLQQRSLSAKYAYHSYRKQSMKSPDTNPVNSFYRYWRMQRHENKRMREWISSLKSALRLK